MNDLVQLKPEELDKIVGITTLGIIKIRALQYITSNIDELMGATKHHRRRVEEKILRETEYIEQFHGINAYCLGEANEEWVPGASFAVSEYEVTCYRMEDSAYSKIPKI